MTLYMYQASYTAKSMAAQLKEPQDPVEVIRPALEDLGAKILVAGFPFGEYDVLVVYEAPDDIDRCQRRDGSCRRGRGQVRQDHATAQRAGMARIFAQTQDCQNPESALAARPSAPIAGTLIERRQIRGWD